MKETCVLRFSSLSDLALFVKLVQPEGYTINTVCLSLCADLSAFELSLAIENYNAQPQKKMPA